jgi:hypothetical protein
MVIKSCSTKQLPLIIKIISQLNLNVPKIFRFQNLVPVYGNESDQYPDELKYQSMPIQKGGLLTHLLKHG